MAFRILTARLTTARLIGLAVLGLLVTVSSAVASSTTITTDGTAYVVSTTSSGELANITFPAVSGHRYSIRLSGSTMHSATVAIKNPSGNNIQLPVSMTSGKWFEPFTAGTTGNFKIVVDPASTYTGSVTVQVWDVPADATGTVATDGTPTTLTTTTPGQNGSLTFSGTSGTRISMVTSGISAPSSSVSIKQGSTVIVPAFSVGSAGTFTAPVTLPTTGTYTISMNPPTFITGSVTFAVYTVPADQSGSTSIGSSQALSFTVPGQNAVYTFPGTASQKVTLAMTPDTIIGGTVTLKNLTTNAVLATAPLKTAGSLIEPVTLPSTGNYSITVDPSAANVGDVTLNLALATADQASSASAGTPTSLNLNAYGQNGVVSFAGTSGQRFDVLIDTNSIGSSKVSITKPDGSALYTATTIGAVTKFFDVVTLGATGTYKITVDPVGLYTGSMNVTVYNPAADVTNTAVIGTPLTQTFATPGQNGVVNFPVTAGQRYTFGFTSNSVTPLAGATSATVKVSNPGGTQVVPTPPATPINLVGTTDKFLGPYTFSSTGTYKLALNPAIHNTGSITVTIYNVSADATGTITPASNNSTAATTISTVAPGQNAYLTFSGTAGQKIAAYYTNNTISPGPLFGTHISLLFGTTTVVSPYNVGQGSTWREPVTLPSTGTYKLYIDPDSGNYGSISVNLYNVPADANGGAITIGGSSVTATTTVPGQNASFSFTTTSATPVTIQTGACNDPTTCVISGKVIIKLAGVVKKSQSILSGNSFTFTPAAGTNSYTVTYDGDTNQLGDYNLAIS